MKLDELARRIGAKCCTAGPADAQITRIYAGDRVSDLLNEASSATLLVTNLANLQMVRVAELMEVPGICFVDGVEPEGGGRSWRRATETMLVVLPRGGLRDVRADLPVAGRLPERGRRLRRRRREVRTRSH